MKSSLSKNTFLLVLCLLAGMASKSQTADSSQTTSRGEGAPEKALLVFMVPQYVMVDGIRADIEIRGKGKKSWWVLSPYYYQSNENTVNILLPLFRRDSYYDEHYYKELKGGGLGLCRKHFLADNSSEKGFHLKYGGVYRFYNIFGSTNSYQEFVGEGNLTYLQLRKSDYTLIINHLQLKAEMGYQHQMPAKNFFFDIYMGFATSFAFHSSPQNVDVKFERSRIDYGYSGISFITGIRFGIKI